MKYVLDENTQISNGNLPDGIINAQDLFIKNGFGEKGISDKILLKLCEENSYVLITKDMGLILKANARKQNIIYASGIRGNDWIYFSNELEIRNRLRLKRMVVNAINQQRGGESCVYVARKLYDPENQDPKIKKAVYDNGDIIFSNQLLTSNIFFVGFSVVDHVKAIELRSRLVKARIERVE